MPPGCGGPRQPPVLGDVDKHETMIDQLGLAALKVSLADYEVSGFVVHPSNSLPAISCALSS